LTGCPPESGDDSTPTVNGVTVTAAGGAGSVPKGGSLRFKAIVIGTNNPDPKVEWSITTLGIKQGTGITEDGLLTVAAAETNEFITVKATSVADRNKSETESVGVTFTPVIIDPKTVTVAPGSTKQFTADPSNVNWTIVGEVAEGTAINGGGLLAVAAQETAQTLTVRATSSTDPNNYAQAIVTVSHGFSVTGVTVTSANTITEVRNETTNAIIGWTLQFTAQVVGQNITDPNVTWDVDGETETATNITPNPTDSTRGLLFVVKGESAETLTVVAKSVLDPRQYGVAIVTVSARSPSVVFHYNYTGAAEPFRISTVDTDGKVSKPNPDPTRPYYTFAGWYKDKACTNSWAEAEAVISSDQVNLGSTIDRYAKWTPVSYTINYNLNADEGEVNPTARTTYTIETETYTLPTPSKPNNLFLGWYDNSLRNGSKIPAIPRGSHGDKEFYAKWMPSGDSAIVYYWVNEGTLRLSVSEFTLGGNRLTIAPQDTGYSDHTWYVNGVAYNANDFPDSLGNSGSSYIFNGASRETGKRYTVGLRVRKNGQYYYAETSIMIQ
jgi:uncharacterized repeat protein (TIGR02543 family)